VKLRDNPPSSLIYTRRYEGTHGETPFAHLLLRELARQFNEGNGREHFAQRMKVHILDGYFYASTHCILFRKN